MSGLSISKRSLKLKLSQSILGFLNWELSCVSWYVELYNPAVYLSTTVTGHGVWRLSSKTIKYNQNTLYSLKAVFINLTRYTTSLKQAISQVISITARNYIQLKNGKIPVITSNLLKLRRKENCLVLEPPVEKLPVRGRQGEPVSVMAVKVIARCL